MDRATLTRVLLADSHLEVQALTPPRKARMRNRKKSNTQSREAMDFEATGGNTILAAEYV